MSSNINKLELIINLGTNDPCGYIFFNCNIVSQDIFNVHFRIISDIKEKLKVDFTAKEGKKLLLNEACERAKNLLNNTSFDLFRNAELSTNTESIDFESKENIDDNEFTKKVEIELTNVCFSGIKEQAIQYQLIQDKFKSCKDELRERSEASPLGIKRELHKINSLISNLESIIDSGNIGDLENWYNEKIANIRGYFKELSRRKDQSNSTYQTHVHQIQRALYGFHCPDTFHKKPLG